MGSANPVEPWFHRRPGLTIAVACALFAVVLGLRWLVAGPEPITLLFCFPIALLAVAFGLRAGLLAGLVGIVLGAVWASVGGVELVVLGLGDERRADAAARRSPGPCCGSAPPVGGRTEPVDGDAQRHRDAVDFNDRVVQELAAAKWALEAGHSERGLDILMNTLEAAQNMVSQMLRDADADADSRRPARTGDPRPGAEDDGHHGGRSAQPDLRHRPDGSRTPLQGEPRSRQSPGVSSGVPSASMSR